MFLLLFAVALSADAEPALVRKPLSPASARIRVKAIAEYRLKNYTLPRPLAWPVNKYFCRRVSGIAVRGEVYELDEQGFPLNDHPLGDFYHPITISRIAINAAISYMNTDNQGMYLRATATADKLIEIMGPDGALRYRHAYKLTYGSLPAGWTSAMSQGSALSAFARVYHITCDRKYVNAGNKALAHLLEPIERGGTTTTLAALDPALSGSVWYEEYPHSGKPGYTLNGYMYTLLGLYDWAEATGSPEAKRAFDAGVQSLVKVLPLFDYDGFSIYDLAPMVHGTAPLFNPHYHRVHMMQLAALYARTREEIFETYRERWYQSVGGTIQPCDVGR